MTERISYFEDLNALRAIAALVVVFGHCLIRFSIPDTHFHYNLVRLLGFNQLGSYLGVVFFFCLSGFLITYLLTKETEEFGSINLKGFYIRRVLRIWPMYYFAMVVGFVVYPYLVKLSGNNMEETANFILYPTFLTNYDEIYFDGTRALVLRVLWSVSIEEQFYALWPLLFFFFSKKNTLPFVLLLIFISSEVFYLSATSSDVQYFHFFSCMRFLAFGGILGYCSYTFQEKIISFIGRLKIYHIFILYSIGLYVLFYSTERIGSTELMIYLFFGFVLMERSFSNYSITRFGWGKVLTWIGTISYSLYLIHAVVLYIVEMIFPESDKYFLVKLVTVVILSILLSQFLYVVVEKPFLRLRKKFSVSR